MKRIIAAGAVLLLIVIAVLAFGSRESSAPNNQDNNASQSTTSNQNNQPANTDKVTIQNFSFSPASIAVKKGTKVTWTNKDSTSHTVTETDGKNGPSSSPLHPDQTYSFTFNETGSFKYHCSIHTDMTGTVTVTD